MASLYNDLCYWARKILKYPEELNDVHSDCHLAPEKTEIKESVLSDFCGKIANKNRSVDGIITCLGNKEKGVLIIETFSYIYC